MWKSFRGLAAENVEKFPWEDVRRPLAATRVAASGRGKCGKVSVGEVRRPLAATCGHSSGCKWLPVTRKCCHLRPLAATRVAVRGCKWLPVTRECWRPLAATGVAAGDKKMPAATCGHSSGCKWLPFPKSNYAPPACSMKRQKKEDPGTRKGRKVAKHCGFSNDLRLRRVEK